MCNRKREYLPLAKALLTSLAFVAATLTFGVYWETNDDPGIAYLLSYEGNYYSPFQWRIFAMIIHFLYVHFPVIDWWAVNTIFALWVGTFGCSYVIYRRYPKWQAGAVSCMILIILWMTTARSLNFTRTAAAVVSGGTMLLADSVLKQEQKNPVEFAFGCLLMLYGASIRSEVALIGLGFLAVVGGARLIANHFDFRIQWIKDNRRWIAGLCLCAIIVLGGFGIHSLSLTPEQREYLEYNTLRSQIEDYPNMYPPYEAAPEVYAEAGFDWQTMHLFLNWYSEDTDVMTKDALETIVTLKSEQKSLSALDVALNENNKIVVIAFVLAIVLMFRRKQNFFRIAAADLLARVCNVAMSYMGRLPSRVYVSILLLAVCAMVFLSGEDDVILCEQRVNPVGFSVRKLLLTWNTALTLILCIGAVVSLNLIKGDVRWSWENRHAPWEDVSKESVRSQALDLINADIDHIFIVDILNEPFNSIVYNYSFWEAKPAGYCENYFVLGGWSARHPYMIKRLSEYGISNPTRALFENASVYSTYSPRTFDYLRSKYDSKMTVSEIATVSGVPFIQYCAYIDDAEMRTDSSHVASIREFYYVNKESRDTWYLRADVDFADPDNVYYCNITVDSVRYTYRLNQDGKNLSAYFYGIGESLNLENADIAIIECSDDMQYCKYTTQ